MGLLKKINWTNTIFLILTPIVGIVGTILLLTLNRICWPTWILAGILIIFCGFSITTGYHRLFSHVSYKAHGLVRLIFILFGSACFEGSVLEWSTDHRNHHRYTDTEKDPYNINQGFWYAHMGWLLILDKNKRNFENVADLTPDPLLQFQHRFFVPIAVLIGFILPTSLAALWGDPLGGFIIAGALRITFNHHSTFCINSVCHYFGKKTYSSRQSARDHWFTALFTFGEGFHNFHHQFALDYRNGIRAYDFDPTKWLIWGLSRIGLAWDLKRVSDDRILAYKNNLEQEESVVNVEKNSTFDLELT